MRNKKILTVLSVLCAMMFCFGLSACGHEHTFATEWTSDASQHWHAATCEHKDEKKDAAAHVFKDGKCSVCGKEEPNYTPPHTHTFDEKKWVSDEKQHWHPATCDHREEKKDAADHTFENGKCSVCGKEDPNYLPPVTTAKLEYKSLKIGVGSFEWGPSYNKLIFEFDGNVSGFDKDTFSVALELTFFDWGSFSEKTEKTPRTVLDVYASDKLGNKTAADSKYLTIEFAAKNGEANPFNYDVQSGRNSWVTTVPPVFVQVKEGKSFCHGNTTVTAGEEKEISLTPTDRIVPQTASWHKDTVTEGNYTLTRASWAPQNAETDGGKNPLVIWLHGAGEGGTDIDIALLGNEVTALTTENTTNIQHYFAKDGLAGAYVLALQTPTMWMDDGTGQYNNTGTGKQESCYTAALWKAITSYVEGNSDIDTSRIYLGGCSNGGYMTMNMMFEHGEYFAAFYPICEAYMNSRITDEMIAGIKNYNIWFLLSADDTTVKPAECEFPTFMRLIQSSAPNTHMTLTANVKGTDDPSASYMGHYSWIYAFNDQVKNEFPNSKLTEQSQLVPANCIKETNMWEWIALQKKGENHAPTTPDPDLPATPTPGPGGEPVTATVFEFENAVLVDGTAVDQNGNPTPITVESGPVYGGTETVTNLGYFHSGASATFTITASKECDVTITLHASSAVADMSQMNWQTSAGLKMAAIDLSKNEYFTFTVNGQQATFTGILPETENASFFDAQCYRHMGTGTVKVHLNAGKNVLKFETNPSNGSGINLDKITIDAEATLTWRPTDNSARVKQS